MGTVLLLGITVALVTIFAVFLFSQNTPVKVPNVNFMVGINNQNPPTLFLTHNGGDTLTLGTFSVYVDGISKSYSVQGGGTTWSVGQNLQVPLSSGQAPQNVILVYNQTQGTAVIGSASANLAAAAVNVAPYVLPTVTPAPSAGYIFNDIANITNSSYFIPAIQQNVTSTSISFWRSTYQTISSPSCNGLCYDNKSGTNGLYYYTFTVNDNGVSSITYGASTSSITSIPLKVNDVVNISLTGGNVNDFDSFGIAPSIWELSVQTNVATLQINFANGTKFTQSGTYIVHTRVGNYTNLHSTLWIDTADNGQATGLTVNGTQHINGLDSTTILLTNVRPGPVGVYLIFSSGGDHTLYFVGKADQISYNGVPQTFL
jgi:hypothetical protein